MANDAHSFLTSTLTLYTTKDSIYAYMQQLNDYKREGAEAYKREKGKLELFTLVTAGVLLTIAALSVSGILALFGVTNLFLHCFLILILPAIIEGSVYLLYSEYLKRIEKSYNENCAMIDNIVDKLVAEVETVTAKISKDVQYLKEPCRNPYAIYTMLRLISDGQCEAVNDAQDIYLSVIEAAKAEPDKYEQLLKVVNAYSE